MGKSDGHDCHFRIFSKMKNSKCATHVTLYIKVLSTEKYIKIFI